MGSENFSECSITRCKNTNARTRCRDFPHVDSLMDHIAKWIELDPSIGELEHSMENPNPNLRTCRYFVAMEDHVEGQDFIINEKPWIWKKVTRYH